MQQLLYTAKELAPILSMAPRTIREWAASGTEGFPGPVIDRPTKKLWHADDIKDWLGRRRGR